MKTTSSLRRSLLLAAGTSLLGGSPIHAANGTWNVDADGLWSTAGNWTPGIADGSGFTASFTNDITADRTVSLDGDRTLTNVVYGDSDTATAGSWILNNNSTPANNLILAGTTPTITVNALGTAKTATISAIIQGPEGMTKQGTGTLILSGANTYTGTTIVNAGTLRLGAAGVLADTSNLTINSGATLNMGGFAETIGTLTLNRGTITGFGGSDTVTLGTGSGGFITNGGTVANWPGIRLGGNFQYNTDGGNETTANIGAFNFGGASRTFTVADGVQAIDVQVNVSLYDSSVGNRNFIKAGPGTMRISGGVANDNYNLGSGTTSIQDGVLELNKLVGQNAVGGSGMVTVGDGAGAATSAVLRYVGANDQIPGNAITVNSDGLLDIANKTDAVGAVTLAGGSITGTTGVLTGSSYAFQSGSASAILGGSGALTKTTAGTVTLSAANTYTGNTTVSGGTFKVTGAGRLYSATFNNTAVVTVQSGGVLELDTWSYGTSQSLGQLANAAARISINGGTIRMNGTTTYGRGVTVLAGGATFEAAAGANWSHANSGDGLIANVYTGNPSLTFTGAGTGNFGKVFSGNGSLTKSGAGTWTLSVANSYTGATTVSAGTLVVNGSLANTATTVASASSARLQGSGLIVGPVTVGDNGTLAPGNSIESLGTGALTFDANSTFDFEFQTGLFAGTPNDSADLAYSTGALSIAPGALLTLSELGTSTALAIGSKLTLVSYTGAAPLGVFTHGGSPLADGDIKTIGANSWQFKYADTSGGPNFAADQSGAGNFFTMTVVPEAGTAGLLALGLLLIRSLRRVSKRA